MLKKWLIASLTALTMAGCGSQVVYSNLDWIIIEFVEDYVELTDEQEDLATEKINRLLQWAAKEEVPKYLAHIDDIKGINVQSIDEQNYLAQEERAEAHWLRIVDKVIPEVTEIVATFNDDQVSELMDNIRENHTEYKQEVVKRTKQDSYDRYVDNISDSFETWFDGPNKQQKALIEKWAGELEIASPEWVEFQTHSRIRLKQALRNRTDTVALEAVFKELVTDPEDRFSGELKRKADHNETTSLTYFMQALTLMEPKQVETFHDELDDWVEILQDFQTYFVNQ